MRPILRVEQARALELLLEGGKVPEVATEVGVSRATVWRWTREPDFAARLTAARDERAKAAFDRLDQAVLDALEVIVALVRDPEAPPTVRLKAAESVLSRAGLPPATERRSDPRQEPQSPFDAIVADYAPSRPVCPYDDDE
jgi:AcrR family transcriptional regulator